MKPICESALGILVLMLALAPSSRAQEASSGTSLETGYSGMVVYDETVKFDIDLPPQMQQFRDRMDDTRKSAIVVIFDESTSLSQPAPEAEPEEQRVAPNDRRNRRFQVFGRREVSSTFINFETEEAVQHREFLDRSFLIEGAAKPVWRMTTDVSEFLGYQAHRALATIDTVLVEAWFTPEIPVPAGPDEYYGLPGLILVLTTDGGNRSYVAREVSLRAVDPAIITAPTEGKKISRADFDKLVEEKRKEQQAMRPGRPLRIRND